MKISKNMLQQAMEEIMDEDLERMDKPLEEDLNQQMEASKERLDWEELYRKGQKPDKRKVIRWQKAAAVFLILLVMGSSTAYAIAKVQKAGVKWDTTWGINEDNFIFKAENAPMGTASPDNTQKETVSAPTEIKVYYEPTYIPDGYKKVEEEGAGLEGTLSDMSYHKTEKNGKIKIHSITVTQSVFGGTIGIDAKNMTRKTVYIDGWKGQLNYKKNKISIIWATDEYVFSAHSYGDASVEELLKVARSLKPVEKK